MSKKFKFTPEAEIIYQGIKSTIIKGKRPVPEPVAIVLGGQPGSGKSNIYKFANQRFNGNIVEIDCDKFRKYHPKSDEYSLEPYTYGEKTNPLISEISDRLVKELSDDKYNMIIESPMKSTHKAFWVHELTTPKGYTVEAHIMATPKDTSWQGVNQRFLWQLENGEQARIVPPAVHDLTVEHIADAAQEISTSGKMANMYVFQRDGSIIYDMGQNPTVDIRDVLTDTINPNTPYINREYTLICIDEDLPKLSEHQISYSEPVRQGFFTAVSIDFKLKEEAEGLVRLNYKRIVSDEELEALKASGIQFLQGSIKTPTGMKKAILCDMADKDKVIALIEEHNKNTPSKPVTGGKRMTDKEFTELLEQARHADLTDYFRTSGYTINKKNGEIYIAEIKGLVINPESNSWYSHYLGVGRHDNSIDCLTRVLDKDFKEAVYELTGQDISHLHSSHSTSERKPTTSEQQAAPKSETTKPKKEMVMPERAPTQRRVFAYLHKSRYIPNEIIKELIDAKVLYQTEAEVTCKINDKEQTFRNANAVFVHRDNDGNEVGGELQGLNSNKRFKGMIGGTGETFFSYVPVKDVKPVKAFLFESAIDLMSFYSMCDKEKLKGTMLVSMSGLKPHVPRQLREQGIKVISAVDNDEAGRKFEEENGLIRSDFVQNKLDIHEFKDWNERLEFQTKHPDFLSKEIDIIKEKREKLLLDSDDIPHIKGK